MIAIATDSNDKSLMLLELLCQTGKQEQLYDNPKYKR